MMRQPLRVLVVEDELLIRWSIAEMLGASGHLVVQAGSACEALREIAAVDGRFDVVLLDVRLPDCGDFSLLRHIRRLTRGAAVVIMTAYGTPELASEGLRLGAGVVLDKPFALGTLEPVLWSAHREVAAGPPS